MRIEVHGIPAPQGSKRHVGGGRMVEQSRAVGPWREAVRTETQRALDKQRLAGFEARVPVMVEITFWLARPKSAPKSLTIPVKRPDVDKLARAVLDGLVAGGAFADDSQVFHLTARKLFADLSATRSPGCTITIEGARDDDA